MRHMNTYSSRIKHMNSKPWKVGDNSMASLDFTGESYVKGATTCGLSPKHMISIWLVVWNINFIFPYIWNVIIIFQRGRLNHQPSI